MENRFPALAFAALLALPAAGAGAPTPSPVDSLSGARHHALEMPLIHFYGVFLPRDFDPSGRRKYPLCVILHGSGSTEVGHGLSLSGGMDLDGIIYIAPRAPYPKHEVFMESRKPGWTAWPEFPPAWGNPRDSSFPSGEVEGLDPINLYADWIARCILDARNRYPVEGKAVVVGHSQGAAFAQYFSARHPDLVKAYAAYAGSFWRSLENDSAALALKAAKVHPFILHGEADSVTATEESRKLVAYLEKNGVAHTKAFYPKVGHSLEDTVLADLRTFTARWCLGKPAPKRKGLLLVHGVLRGSQADSAGLRPGDRIVSYDGKPLRSRADLMAAVKAADSTKPRLAIGLEKDGKRRTVPVKPGVLGVYATER